MLNKVDIGLASKHMKSLQLLKWQPAVRLKVVEWEEVWKYHFKIKAGGLCLYWLEMVGMVVDGKWVKGVSVCCDLFESVHIVKG